MDARLNDYLEQVDRHLRPMPAAERVDIVQEIKSEILELEAQGLTPGEILQRLGGARELAAAYLGDAIAKNPRFSWSRLGTVAAFWGLAGITGMFVLPITSVMAVALMISGVLAPIGGVLKLGAFLVGEDLPFVMFQIGSYTAPAPVAAALSVLFGALHWAAGRWLWRVTVGLVQRIGRQYRTAIRPLPPRSEP